ncbi:hypothetical protein C3K47_11940 [Solitalea longa]|uniref:Uncharacterized protein n=1 Tax=Solitalea longa TaxID=2079460 RepID=A0A2S5A2D4_9SPHI|nr:hypothetical protein [Solitalea longa]POY36447.1 hypothetical protein C3K47_11940 [Solitalea longa]
MYHEISFEYNGKVYKRTVVEAMRSGFVMQSKGIDYWLQYDADANSWRCETGAIPENLMALISIELHKIKRYGKSRPRNKSRYKGTW